jgi:hypothetical protein
MADSRLSTLATVAALVSNQYSPDAVPESAWPAVANAAIRHNLGPMLLWTIREGGADNVPLELIETLRREMQAATMRLMLFEQAQHQIQMILDQHAIPSVWLKGLHLASTLYPNPALRPMRDLDVLVPYKDRHQALQAVAKEGFHTYKSDVLLFSDTSAIPEQYVHHYDLRGGVNDSVFLELHYRLLRDPTLISHKAEEWFWSQVRRPAEDSGYGVLRDEARLLYLSAHAFLHHGEAGSDLRYLFDVHQLVTLRQPDWQIVVDQAVTFQWAPAVDRALSLSQHYFGTQVPNSVVRQLQSVQGDVINAKRVSHLQQKGYRWENITRFLSQLSFGQRLRVVARLLFPPVGFMRSRYEIKPERPVWPLYLYRWADLTGSMLSALRNRLSR